MGFRPGLRGGKMDMNMPNKRQILSLLTRDELLALADQHQLKVQDRRIKEQVVAAAASSRKVSLSEALTAYSRDRLKELCRALHLDDGGKEKGVLVERLVGETPTPA